MERCDFVNDDLRLIQDMEGLTFGTDALLLAGYVNGKFKRGVELGSGSGIISMLLLTRGKVEKVTALEVQEHYADLTRRNAELNGLTDRMECLCTDVREYIPSTEAELVFTNPPYMKTDSGKKNIAEKKNIARHEVNGDIYDFCKSARKMLKFGGNFVAVYRPDRLIDLIDAMRSSKIEPKRMTLVYADTDSEPSMALIEGKAGGRSGLLLTKPLIIYRDSSHKEYTDDMNYIMENGSFPSDYKR
jgi:tRNA1(Val) A37 N6-methylase TrmN6